MNKTYIQFFELIKSSLNNKIFTEDIIDDLCLYAISRDNGLSGMIFNSLDSEKISSDVYKRFEKAFYNFYMKDTLQNREIEQINNIFNLYNIDHVFLKGSFLKEVYPASFMRSMGDIDLLIRQRDLQKAKEVMLANGFKHYISVESHECFISENGGLVEIHTRLNSENIDRYDKFLLQTWDNVCHVDSSRYELGLEYNLVYLLIHMVKHFNSSGIGLRSVLDIGLFMNKYSNELSIDKLMTHISECNLQLFFTNILWLNQKYFEFDFEYLLNGFSQDEEFLNDITNFIITSGVHGRGGNFNRFTCKMTMHARNKNNIRKGKFAYIIQVIFPSYRSMRSTYTYLNKFPYFLPFAWLSRWCKLIFKKTKSTFSKIKKLFVKKDNIEEVIKLYEKLGV